MIEAPIGFAHRLGLSVLRLHLVSEVSVALDCATVDRLLSQYRGIASRVTATDLFRWSRDGEVRSRECRVVAHVVGQVVGLVGPSRLGCRTDGARCTGWFGLRRRLRWSPSFGSWGCRTARKRIPGGYRVVLIYLFDPNMF